MCTLRRLRPTLTVAVLAAGMAGCSEPPPYRQESYVFGTRVELTIAGTPEPAARSAAADALALLDSLHQRWHAWQPDSEVAGLNRAFAAGRSAPVAPDLAGLLRQAQEYETRADGLFSSAIGALVARWGFHGDHYASAPPSADTVRALARQQPRLADLTFSDNRVASRNPAVQLDLGGVAKGWALDAVRARWVKAGLRSALLNIGGNILALGRHPDGTPWRVGLQHPRAAGAMATVTLDDGEAIGTSGDYQRYFLAAGGRRYCHLIDPRDGSANCRLQSATVIVPPSADAGARSDAATKPIYLGGVASAMSYARRFGIEAVLLVDGQGEVWVSPAMARRLAWQAKPSHIHLLT